MVPLSGIAGNSSRAVMQPEDTGSLLPKRSDPTSGQPVADSIRLPEDRVTISGGQSPAEQPDSPGSSAGASGKQATSPGKPPPDSKRVEDPQIQAQIARLKQIEVKVKAHEAAHKAVGGNLASSASYSYTRGPDGRSYITGGEVQINMSDGKTPEETISRMQQVIRAALAPADPSGQDRAVAAQAASRMSQAQQEKLQAENPTAKPDPGRPIDPAEEASRLAASPDKTEDTTAGFSSAAPEKSDFSRQIRQAYSSTAAQGGKPMSTGQTTGPSFTTGSAPFSALA